MGNFGRWMTMLLAISSISLEIQSASSRSGDTFLSPSRAPSISPRPNPNEKVTFARWLAAQATWGVVSTLSVRLNGAPWGNVQSFSDGMPGNGTGTPYFYLSKLDETPNDILKDARASFTISEETVGTCTDDPEMPTCAKMTLSGNLTKLVVDQPETIFAKAALIIKHPIFQDLPDDHQFEVYKLVLDDVWLVDFFGGAKYITPIEYYNNE